MKLIVACSFCIYIVLGCYRYRQIMVCVWVHTVHTVLQKWIHFFLARGAGKQEGHTNTVQHVHTQLLLA
jgi:hypothetical protein